MIDIPILYEDDAIVVIDKPVGVVVNRAETVTQPTLQDWMEERYQIANHKFSACAGRSNSQIEVEQQYFIERSGMVHRLDKETMGVMVFAKTVTAFGELLRQFKEREVTKIYLALTHGSWDAPTGEIMLPIGRRRDDRQKFGVREGGRESVTGYQVQARYARVTTPKELHVDGRGYQGFSLVEFYPKTGRTHQIRVHARHVGHPLVGDLQYAGRRRSREDRKWCGHVMLQARSLVLTHPVTQARMEWQSSQDLLEPVRLYLGNEAVG
jgi:23S rRNA pseudouridine1911/1915/1917 synthase